MSEPSLPWSEGFAAAVGRRVARYRRDRRLSAQQLSDELKAQLGLDMKRTVIGGLESGARKAVTVTEILGIAYVLRVSPLLLLFPVGGSGWIEADVDESEEAIEALPGHVVDTWSAAKWFTGEAIFPTHWPDDDAKAWRELRESALPLQLYRHHERLVAERRASVDEFNRQLAHIERLPDDEHSRGLVKSLESIVIDHGQRIGILRDEMRRSGVTPPPLPTDLADFDSDQARGRSLGAGLAHLTPTDPTKPQEES